MYTYFIVATETEVARMQTLDHVLSHIERIEPLLGGNVDLETIASLSNAFLQSDRRSPKQTQHALLDGSLFYLLDAEVCEKMASTEHEQLLNASVLWDDESWKETDVNRMDLAGFLLDLAALCREAEAKGASLYVLPSKEE